MLAWQDFDTNTSQFTMHGAVYINGSGVQDIDTLSAATTMLMRDLDVAINAGRDAIVTWASAPNASAEFRPQVAQYSSTPMWHNKMVLPAGAAIRGDATRAAINDSGVAFVAWGDSATGLTYANRFTPAGGWQTADALTSSGALNTPEILSLAVASTGNAICIFAHAPTLDESLFKYRRYIDGAGWEAMADIEEPGSVGNPNLSLRAAYNADGKGVLFWQEAGDIVDGDTLYFVGYDFMELAPNINP